jgi:hypothetical protein
MHYRVHRIKETPREAFRWAPHTGGLAIAKAKDYEPGEELEAATPYAAWKFLAQQGAPLRPGDLLECLQPPSLQITKYIGFEPAQWFVPETKGEAFSSTPCAAGQVLAESSAVMSNEIAIAGNAG